MKRTDDSEVVRAVMKMNVESQRDRGRPKNRWIDGIESDIKITSVAQPYQVGSRYKTK